MGRFRPRESGQSFNRFGERAVVEVASRAVVSAVAAVQSTTGRSVEGPAVDFARSAVEAEQDDGETGKPQPGPVGLAKAEMVRRAKFSPGPVGLAKAETLRYGLPQRCCTTRIRRIRERLCSLQVVQVRMAMMMIRQRKKPHQRRTIQPKRKPLAKSRRRGFYGALTAKRPRQLVGVALLRRVHIRM